VGEPVWVPTGNARELRPNVPKQRRNGHQLGPNRMLLIWRGCGCASALANGKGHQEVLCRKCGDVQLLPPCDIEA
jgi:hypothetical protein